MDLAPYLPGIFAAYAILLVGALSPGPAVAMLIGLATTRGRTPALIASLGIACGSLGLNLLTMAGVGLLIQQAAWAMMVLKLAGSAYLLWLAYGALKRAVAPPDVTVAQVAPLSALQAFTMGALMQLTNPKAVAFWLAIASLGAVRGAENTVVAAFALGAMALSFLCHAAWAVLLSTDVIRRAYGQARRWVEASIGAFLTLAAFRLALERP